MAKQLESGLSAGLERQLWVTVLLCKHEDLGVASHGPITPALGVLVGGGRGL